MTLMDDLAFGSDPRDRQHRSALHQSLVIRPPRPGRAAYLQLTTASPTARPTTYFFRYLIAYTLTFVSARNAEAHLCASVPHMGRARIRGSFPSAGKLELMKMPEKGVSSSPGRAFMDS